jgi:hypothetical protein
MAGPRKTGLTRKDRHRRRAGQLACLALILLAGCANNRGSEDDPLVGGSRGKAPPPPEPVTQKARSAAVPPVPETNASTSNAAWAIAQPLAGGRPLRIDDQVQPAGASSWQAVGTGVPTATPVLRRPEPIVEPVPVVPSGNAGVVAAPSGASGLEQLRARGFRPVVETIPNGVLLTCFVPSPANPLIERTFEASGSDLATAIQAVLKQIDQNPDR